MRAEEIKGLMEAYSKVHETPEVLNEEVEILSERGFPGMTQAKVDAVKAQSAAEAKSRSRIDALRQQRFGSGGSPSAGKSAKPTPAAPAKPVAAPAAQPAAPAASEPAKTEEVKK